MPLFRCSPILVLLAAATLNAQTFTNSSLNGKYFVRHIQFTTDAGNNVTDARSILGALTFNGGGNYSFTGQQLVGSGAATAFSVSGTYSVSAGGNVTLTNPQSSTLTVNARLGPEAVIGASTEAPGNTFDYFVAIPAPTTTASNAALNGAWQATDFELPGASVAQVRDSFVTLAFDGAGNITLVTLKGHAANFNSGALVNQTLPAATYTVNTDGTGSTFFPAVTGFTGGGLMLGTVSRNVYVSQTGHVMLAATPGAHDIFIAVKTPSGTPALTGRSWTTGLRIDTSGSSDNYVGSSTVITADSSVISTRRLHTSTSATAINETAAALFTLAADGTGSAGSSKIAVGTTSQIGANVGNIEDPTGYEIAFGDTIPAVTGPGVFVNPQGIVNAAGNAPAGDAISPGEFIAIYGSGLSAQTTSATPPYPKSLGGVTVTIGGIMAPVYLVSAGQINCLVPFALDTTKPTATLTVNNNGTISNSAAVPVAKTSPGIFSNDTSGTGDGAFLHLSNLQVTPASPAKKGETLSVYLTGLGGLVNPVADGTAPNPPAADSATTQLAVYVNGLPAQVLYSGINPVYPGLYQINFVVPAGLTLSGELPVAIQTPEAFTDEINLSVQ